MPQLSARFVRVRSAPATIRAASLILIVSVLAALLVTSTSDAAPTVLRVDAGGAASDGWSGDTRESGSPYLNLGASDLHTTGTSAPIAGVPSSVPASVFQTLRTVRPTAEPMRWTLPAPNGGVGSLSLYFSEFRDRFTQPGSAVFDIAVNGTVVFGSVDVAAEVGLNRALVKTVELSTKGDVTVEIVPRVGWPAIAGLELILDGPAPTTTVKPVTTTTAPTTTKPTAPPTTTAPTSPPTTTAPTTPPTTTPPSNPTPTSGKLAFKPPTLTNPTTIKVTPENRGLKLAAGRDYIIDMPDTPLVAKGGVTISGGRNVVLIGGHIHHDRWWGDSPGKENRGFLLQGQTGTIHIEGVLVSGFIGEGIDLSQTEGAIVQLQNIRIESATGGMNTNHADVIQTWAGPRRLLIDRFTGYTSYQGFFLLPNQWYSGPAPERFELRNVNLVGDPGGAGYLYWVDENRTRFPVVTSNLWAQPSVSKAGARDQWLWPQPKTGDTTWNGVKEGRPPEGDIVTRSQAGATYKSPGYAS